MSNLTIFNFKGAAVRTLNMNGEPWFIAQDVCDALEIEQATSSLRSLDDDEKGLHVVQTPGGNQGVAVVSESGMYALALRSRKKEARAFRKWVTAEVLPAIRQNGSYTTPGAAQSLTAELAPAMAMIAQAIQALTGDAQTTKRIANEAADLASEAKRDLRVAEERIAIMQAQMDDRDLDKRQTLRQATESIKSQIFKEMAHRGVGVAKVAHDFWSEVKGRADVASVKVENLTVSAAQRLYAESIRQAQIWGVSINAPIPLDFAQV